MTVYERWHKDLGHTVTELCPDVSPMPGCSKADARLVWNLAGIARWYALPEAYAPLLEIRA
jgi:hypothetical protein